MTIRVAAVLVLAAAGCGRQPAPEPALPPLTIAEWKALPVEQKYEVEAYERLKEGEPKLQSSEGWDAFRRTVLMPSRRKDGVK